MKITSPIVLISLVKDAGLMTYYVLRGDVGTFGESWKTAIFPFNSLVMSALTMTLTVYWGIRIIVGICRSQMFRADSAGSGSGAAANRSIDKSQRLLIKMVLWLLLTNVARVALYVMILTQSGSEYSYANCMNNGRNFVEDFEKCKELVGGIHWRFITDVPVVSVSVSLTDLLALPLFRLCVKK